MFPGLRDTGWKTTLPVPPDGTPVLCLNGAMKL